MSNQHTSTLDVTKTEKTCSLCRVIKPLEEFHKDKNNTKGKGRAYCCKVCANSKARKWNKNVGKSVKSKTKCRDRYYQRTYGITLDEYNAKLTEQDFKCEICKVKLLSYGSGTHLDHCHKTGKLRAMLCTNCNRGLGHFQDDSSLLLKAADYLNKHRLDED